MLVVLVGGAVAADKEVTGTLVKADAKKNVLTVKTDDGEKNYDVNDQTKFIGLKGGVSTKGIKRRAPGQRRRVETGRRGNNKTPREVHIPEKKAP